MVVYMYVLTVTDDCHGSSRQSGLPSSISWTLPFHWIREPSSSHLTLPLPHPLKMIVAFHFNAFFHLVWNFSTKGLRKQHCGGVVSKGNRRTLPKNWKFSNMFLFFAYRSSLICVMYIMWESLCSVSSRETWLLTFCSWHLLEHYSFPSYYQLMC